MKYVIVKNAGDERWPYYWKEDPKITGIVIGNDAAKNHPELSIIYNSLEKAKEALLDIQKLNPGVNYDVCPIAGYNITYHVTGVVS